MSRNLLRLTVCSLARSQRRRADVPFGRSFQCLLTNSEANPLLLHSWGWFGARSCLYQLFISDEDCHVKVVRTSAANTKVSLLPKRQSEETKKKRIREERNIRIMGSPPAEAKAVPECRHVAQHLSAAQSSSFRVSGRGGCLR